MAYIYLITNDVNGKIYIGLTSSSVETRWKLHCLDYNRRDYENRPLYRAMNKYGLSHFHIEVIEETDNPQEREQYWIAQKNSYHQGYNATLGGEGTKTLDYDAIVQTYEQTQNITKTAEILGISYDGAKNALLAMHKYVPYNHKQHNQDLKEKYGKQCLMKDKRTNQILLTFESQGDAARYIKEQGYSSDSIGNIASRIGQVCNGKRQTAYGFKWQR